MVRRHGFMFLGLALLLVGCSPATPSAGAIVGTVVEPSGAPVLGVGLTMVDRALVQSAGGAAELIEIGPGHYATGTAPVAADGSFRLPLPTASELPEGVLSPAGLALALATETPLDPGNVVAHAGRFLVWLYADRPVAIATVGAGCVGNVAVDVALSSGWNVAAWTFDAAQDQLVLGAAPDANPAIVTLLPPMQTP